MKYTIFQCPPTIPYCFLPYDETEFSFADYVPVYSGEITAENNNEVLELIYQTLNIDYPKDYYARSLSVSDLIVFENTKTAYYVQPVGFKQIPYPTSTQYKRRH